MQTGEGKTLVATMPVYLNALTGEGFGQDIVKAGPVFQLFFQVRGFGL